MANKRFGELQKDIEKTVKDLKRSQNLDERKALLRQMRMLIEEADRTVSEESTE